MGRRKISFDPAASTLGRFGSRVMNVSLWGPHSLETSTFLPKPAEEVPAPGSAPFLARNWYLSHQVGSCALDWAETVAAHPHIRSEESAPTRSLFFMGHPLELRGRLTGRQGSTNAERSPRPVRLDVDLLPAGPQRQRPAPPFEHAAQARRQRHFAAQALIVRALQTHVHVAQGMRQPSFGRPQRTQAGG